MERQIATTSDSSTLQTVPEGKLRKSKSKSTVLEEDLYLEKLDKIIQRDFFPDISKLKAQTEYFDAVQNNDQAKIKQLQEKFSSRRTDVPLNTPRSPAFFETPLGNKDAEVEDWEKAEKVINITEDDVTKGRIDQAKNCAEIASGPNVDHEKMGLDKFLFNYTSEDNASFEEILDKNDANLRRKYAWMYEAEEDHRKKMLESMALKRADEQAVLAIEQADPGAKKTPKKANLDNWTYKALNSVMFVPPGQDFTSEELITRQKMSERQIRHENTRLSTTFDPSTSSQPMLNAASIQAAANKGKVDAQGNELSLAGALNRYSFVATPSPAPGANESPFMTWGEIEGTPFRLDASDTVIPRAPGPSFKIPDVPLRDKLADSVTSEIKKKNKEKKLAAIHGIKSLTPKFGSAKSMERLDSMSPAAKRLATSKLGIRLTSDKRLKDSYTPSPIRDLAKTPIVDYATPQTDNVPTSVRFKGNELYTESLTDNLLKLSSADRPKAADYF